MTSITRKHEGIRSTVERGCRVVSWHLVYTDKSLVSVFNLSSTGNRYVAAELVPIVKSLIRE